MLHGLHGDGAVQRQRAGDDAALHAPLRDGLGRHGGRHLVGHVLHGGQHGHLGAVDAQRAGHRQRVLHDADLGLHVRGDVDGGIGDHNEAALILKNAALADKTAAAGGDQARFLVQDGAGEVGGLQDALHGDVGLPFPHQLHGDLGGLQLLTVEVHNLVVLLALAHLMQHGDDLVLLAHQCALDNTLAACVHHGGQGRLVMGIGQRDALFHILAQHIVFQFLEIGQHIGIPPRNLFRFSLFML